MRKGYTMTPCEGCGDTPGYGGREKGKVCLTCQAMLREAKEAREAQTKSEKLPRKVVGRAHGLRYYEAEILTPVRDRLSSAVLEVFILTGEEKLGGSRWYGDASPLLPGHYADIEHYIRYYDEEVAQALAELDSAIRAAIYEAYAGGVKYGTSLLLQIQDGGLTIDGMNERTVDQLKRRQPHR